VTVPEELTRGVDGGVQHEWSVPSAESAQGKELGLDELIDRVIWLRLVLATEAPYQTPLGQQGR
jgi:hypothetical protein